MILQRYLHWCINRNSTMSAATSASARSKRQGEMGDFEKGRIVGLHEAGISKREIGRRLGRNESTIRNFLKR